MTNAIVTVAIQTNASVTHSIQFQIPDISPIWTVILALFAVAAFASVILGMWRALDSHIAKALEKKDVVDRLALLVKPDMIFDARASVLADRGAASFIKPGGIHITMGAPFPNTKLPVEIRIECVRHLAVPPLLTALNADAVTITTKRGTNFDWLYMIHYAMAGDCDAEYMHRYRLEVF